MHEGERAEASWERTRVARLEQSEAESQVSVVKYLSEIGDDREKERDR